MQSGNCRKLFQSKVSSTEASKVFAGSQGVSILWSASTVLQHAAERAILGRAPITGLLPISIPGVAKFGEGVQRVVMK